jgi:hypothetical protein
MATFLVDYENVGNRDGLHGVDVLSENVEDAIKMLNSPDDEARRAELKKRTTMLDLATEYARIEESRAIKKRIKEALTGTQYEEKSAEIIDFVDAKKDMEKKALYTSSLHSFGRQAGREIYQIVKQIVI